MSNNKEKREELELQAEVYQQELTEKVDELKEKAKVRGSQILLVGGVLAGSYLLYSLLSDSDKKNNKESSQQESSLLGSALKSYAIALALSLAKDKIMDYLDSLEKKEEI